MKKQIILPASAEAALRNLGKNIKTARIKKGITATSMAELMDTTRVTLGSIEDGLPSVSMGHYIKALSVLGLDAKITNFLIDETARLG
ncbi:MAG: helix-turn-helix domain-containing protein [Succinivibrio sp.]